MQFPKPAQSHKRTFRPSPATPLQGSLFDGLPASPREHGEALRERAIAQVEQNANEAWKKAALEGVTGLASRLATFTTDHVWAWMRLKHPALTTPEARAMGAVMVKAASEGIVVATKEWELSTRPECHRRPVRVWESLIQKRTSTNVF